MKLALRAVGESTLSPGKNSRNSREITAKMAMRLAFVVRHEHARHTVTWWALLTTFPCSSTQLCLLTLFTDYPARFTH